MSGRTCPSSQFSLFDAWDEQRLVAACVALGARTVPGWSAAEDGLVRSEVALDEPLISGLRDRVAAREDPLGDVFVSLRSSADRRPLGATYTPWHIVRAMLDWAERRERPQRVVDPGVGSARFLVEAGRRFPDAELVGIDVDPLAALMARAHLAAAGMAGRASVLVADYRTVVLPPASGSTLFIGNPPYVRHHELTAEAKQWLARQAARLGYNASKLAGLHVHFFLATVLKGGPGDAGAFITSSEWLDVNYGRLVRELFLHELGGTEIAVIDPTAMPFPDVAATGAISYFVMGSRPETIALARCASADEVHAPSSVRSVSRSRLAVEARWSHFTRGPREVREGYVELGELCRVHRGAVTGANKVWVDGPHTRELPQRLLRRSVTRARDLILAGPTLSEVAQLRSVVDLPEDLDTLAPDDREIVNQFLRYAKSMGADRGYIAQHRRAWWSVGLRRPAPILATYMARRPPAFVRNLAGACHINIAHGLYPRQPLSEEILQGLVLHLIRDTTTAEGRTYAGGLTKFEPREMERLLVPRPERLLEMGSADMCDGTLGP